MMTNRKNCIVCESCKQFTADKGKRLCDGCELWPDLYFLSRIQGGYMEDFIEDEDLKKVKKQGNKFLRLLKRVFVDSAGNFFKWVKGRD